MKNSIRNNKKNTPVSQQNSAGTLLSLGHKPLVPSFIFYYLIFISLTLPNLIFSGISWFDTLHIMKWTFAMVPIAVISMIGGSMLGIFGPERTDFKLDAFGLVWLLMLVYITVQPMWVNITSWSTYAKEWFFFATLWGAYLFCYNLFKDSGYHKVILWAANLNAAINIIFAELLIRNLNGPFPFIMNVPGNYIGNTGQQEMFGLWMAMCAMNGIYLHTAYAEEDACSGKNKIAEYANIFLLAFTSWGMWNSTTRAGILSLITGTIIISLVFLSANDKIKLKRVAQCVALVFLILALNIATGKLGWSRSYALPNKTADMFANTSNFGARAQIWKTSWEIFAKNPIRGVGIGHYKWHYLDGQRLAMEKYSDMKWQYTYWAHSEYLQWLAEFGLFGGLLLFAAGAWWLCSFVRTLTRRKSLSMEASWACAMLFMIWFDAIFSRPFHRIENVLWLAFAFAIANREILSGDYNWQEVKHSALFRVLGGIIAVVSVVGLVFLSGGLAGDKYLRASLETNNAGLQAYRIGKALSLPMSKDDAEEQYAYHLMAVAKVTGKADDWNRAISQLYRVFTIRPQAKQLMELVNIARQSNNQELLRTLIPYLRLGPSMPLPQDNASSN